MVLFIQNDPEHLSLFLSSAHHHVLFDCDGLLLDTEPIYSAVAASSIRQLLLQHNKPPVLNDCELFPESVKFKVMGGTSEQVSHHMASYIASTHDIPVTASEWASIVSPLESHHFSLGCPLMPFVSETVHLFKQKGWPIAVATSSSRHTFLIKSQPHSDLFSNFPVITCGDDLDYSKDVIGDSSCLSDSSCSSDSSGCSSITSNTQSLPKVKGKPHPSIFHTARHHLNRSPSQPGVVLEDSPNGVVAALRSGHSCIWVPAEGAMPGFQLIENVLKEFEAEIPKDKDLWVYRASSLQELHNLND